MKSTFAPQTDREISTPKPPRQARYFESTPFRGLNFFDFEHAAVFHGRTKAIGEVLDALKQQAKAAQRFTLVLGDSGSGKSSLVRAGVLPLLTQGETIEGSGSWRRAVTRPGADGTGWDPLDGLAAALLDQSALPELRISASPHECRNLATVLRTHPEGAALRVKHALDRLSRPDPEPRLDEQESELPLPWKGEDAELAGQQTPGQVKPQAQFALVVDQLEELFTSGFPLELQRRYLAALSALAGCERVFVIATLQSDFFATYQQLVGALDFPASLSACKLDQPTSRELGKMIRLPAEAAGLRFERDPKTGRSLDEVLVEAAAVSPESLPLLEHLLLQLYHKQLERKDGFLRSADYYELGELEVALAHHAESVFSMLKPEEQAALGCVMGHLVTLGSDKEGVVNPRSVPYRDLVSCPGLDNSPQAGAKGLVDRLIEEGLLRAETGPTQEVLVSVAHEALLRGWPRVWQWFSENQEFFRMRDRLDASRKLWLSRACRTEDLLNAGISRAEAKKLAKDFGSSLTETELDYIRESLAYQNRRWGVRRAIGLAVLGGLAVLATTAALIWPDTKILRNATKAYAKLQDGIAHLAPAAHQAAEVQPKSQEQQDAAVLAKKAELVASQRDALQVQLKDTQAQAQQAQKDAETATNQRDALQAQLKDTEAKAQEAQKDAELAASQRDALQTQLKDTEAKAQEVQKNADSAASQRETLQAQLKDTEAQAQQAQQSAELAANQRDSLQAQLKDAEAKAQAARKDAEAAITPGPLQTQLKDTETKVQAAQKDAELAASQRDALQTQLKDTEAKAQQVQKDAELTASQRDALRTQLKDTEAKAQEAQKDAELAASQRDALQTQLKDTEAKAQEVQKDAELAASQRDALQTQLKDTEAKAQEARKDAELAASQRDALQTQLKDTEAKAQQVQKDAELAASQRDALQAQLKDTEAKAQQVQKDAELAASQRDALQSQLKSAEEKPGQVEQLASPAPKNEPITGHHEPVNLASINQNQAAVSLPTPSIVTQANSNPSPAQTDRKGSAEEQSLKQFVRDYIRAVASNDISAQARFFEYRVNYYGEGLLSREKVQATLERYQREWPVRDWEPRGEPQLPNILHSKNPKLYEVLQPFTWAISNGARHEEGSATLDVRLWKNNKGEFHIIYVRHKDADLALIRSKSGETQPANIDGNVGPAASAQLFDSPVQKNEPVTPDQESGKVAPVEGSQATVSVPTPSVSPPVESRSPEPETNKTAEVLEDVTSVKGLVRDYIRSVRSDDVSAQERFFGPKVNFYGEGVLLLPKVQAITERYHREWPDRKWEPQGNPRIVPSADNQYEVLQPFTWSVSNGERHAQGSATLYVRVSKDNKGEFHIVHVAQQRGGSEEGRSISKESQSPNAESR